MGNAIQCRARMVGDGVDAQCQIWTNADPQGRHAGDHDAYGKRWTNFNPPPKVAPAGVASAKLEQVGGDHYRKFKIQPWQIWEEYGLDAFTGTVVKYLLRAGHKGDKLEDLRKARHTLDRLIEIEEGKTDE
jgi:hypothetical protein